MARIVLQPRFFTRCASIAFVLLAWEASARLNLTTSFHLPALSAVLGRLLTLAASGDLATAASQTLIRTLSGFGLAASFGIVTGLLVARNKIARWLLDPLISVGLPTPKIAFLPMFVLWFGVYDQSKILMIAFSAIFPVIVSTAAGADNVDKNILWSAASMGATRRETLWGVVFPAALPQIFTGLQIALPTALIVAVVCEMTLGGFGLGASVVGSMRVMDSTGSFAAIIAIAVLGSCLLKAMELLRKYCLVWHQENQ